VSADLIGERKIGLGQSLVTIKIGLMSIFMTDAHKVVRSELFFLLKLMVSSIFI